MIIITKILLDLAAVLVVCSVCCAVSMVVHCMNYPAYRRTYRAIIKGEMVIDLDWADRDMVYFRLTSSTPVQGRLLTDYAVYFLRGRDFKLLGGGYLHNYPMLYLDPYSLYWMKRLRGVADRLMAGEDPRTLRRDHRIAAIINN